MRPSPALSDQRLRRQLRQLRQLPPAALRQLRPATASMGAPAAEPEVPAVPLSSTNTGEERPPSSSPAAAPAAPVAASETVPPVSVTAPPGLSAEDELWRAATAKDTQAAYQAYLKRYPRGKHADSAKVMLKYPNKVAAAPAPAPAQTEPRASAAEPERKVAPAAASPGPTADRSPTQFAGSNAGGTGGGTQSRAPEPAPSPPQVARTSPEPTDRRCCQERYCDGRTFRGERTVRATFFGRRDDDQACRPVHDRQLRA